MKIAAIMTFYYQLFQKAALENNVIPPLQCCHYHSYQVITTSPLPYDSQNPTFSGVHSWLVQATLYIGRLLGLSEGYTSAPNLSWKRAIIKSHLPLLSDGFVRQGLGYFYITAMGRKGNRFKISHWHEFGVEYPMWKSHANLSKLNRLSWKGLVRRMRMISFIRKHVLKFLERGLCWFRAVLLCFAPPRKGN